MTDSLVILPNSCKLKLIIPYNNNGTSFYLKHYTPFNKFSLNLPCPLQCLENVGILSKLKRFSGASAGAMAAAFIALGYTAAEMEELLSENFEELFNGESSSLHPLLDI